MTAKSLNLSVEPRTLQRDFCSTLCACGGTANALVSHLIHFYTTVEHAYKRQQLVSNDHFMRRM